MTLHEAYNFFESLVSETTRKSELKVYQKFVHIFSELKTREFSKEDIQSIEKELDSLYFQSNPANKKKYFTKSLSKFETYLKDTFSLTTKGYYTNLYSGLGLSFGLLFGVVFLSIFERSLGISLGLIGGMFIGLTIGGSMDAKAKSEFRVL